MESVVKLIQLFLMRNLDGMTINDLNDLYHTHVGEYIPYDRPGFTSLREFLKTIDVLEITHNERGYEIIKINMDLVLEELSAVIRKRDLYPRDTRTL